MPLSVLMGQITLGLVTGSFYALLGLGLGLSIVFGLLHVINFAHGAFYMLGALAAWLMAQLLGIGYWPALVLAPLAVGVIGVVLEKTTVKRLYGRDPLYSLLLTLGIAMVLEYGLLWKYGSAGMAFAPPPALTGALNLGFMILPVYRGWIVLCSAVICLAVWWLVHRTPLGRQMRAATEKPELTGLFGIDVPRLRTLTFGLGAALAALAGVLAAPIYQVSPIMGQSLLIPVFAVIVIGGMGSIHGTVLAAYGIGLAEGITRIVFPEAAALAVYVVMVAVLLLRPDHRQRSF